MFDEADRQFDLLFNGIRAGRSLAASYNLQSDIQSTCFDGRRKGLLLARLLITIMDSFPSYTR